MGLFDILGGIMDKLEEHSPEIMAAMEKAQERIDKQEERRQAFEEERFEYEAEYSCLSNQELQDIVDQGVAGAERAALSSIARKRKAEREKCQEMYPAMSSGELISEYMMIDRQKRVGTLEEPIADLRLSIISKVLKERGWHLNSDLAWVKD